VLAYSLENEFNGRRFTYIVRTCLLSCAGTRTAAEEGQEAGRHEMGSPDHHTGLELRCIAIISSEFLLLEQKTII